MTYLIIERIYDNNKMHIDLKKYNKKLIQYLKQKNKELINSRYFWTIFDNRLDMTKYLLRLEKIAYRKDLYRSEA